MAPWENSVTTQKEDAYCSCCLEPDPLLSQTLVRNRPPVCFMHWLWIFARTFRKTENGFVAFMKLKPYLSSQGWFVTWKWAVRRFIPLISPPRIWFRALLFPHIKTWWGFSGVFVTRGDIFVCQHFQALHCHSILVARTVSLAKHSES